MKARTLHIRHALFLCAFLFGIVGVSWGQATIYDWGSDAPDGNWKQGAGGARWWPGGLWDEPPAGNELRFNNNAFTTMNNNVSGYTLNKLTFGSSATSSRNISGNNITFYDNGGIWPRIDNLSGTSQTIGFPITVGTNSNVWNLELKSSSGPLILNSSSTISNNTSKILFIYGNGSVIGTNYVELDGVISGNGSFRIKQGGIARIGANHTYTGSTTIEDGELWIDNGGDISASVINLGDGSVTNKTAKIHISDLDGGTTFTRDINVNTGDVSRRYVGGFNTSGTNTYTGNILRPGSGNFELNLESTQSNGIIEITGYINGSGAVIKVGSGSIVLSGSNTYTGSTTVSSGTLQLNKTGGGTLPSGNSITVNSGGTLKISSSQTLVDLTVNSGGSLILDNGVTLTITGVLTISGSITLNGSLNLSSGTLAFGNTTDLSFPSGVFTSTIANLSKTAGAGTLTLNDALTTVGNLTTSASTGAVIIAASKQLTVSGTLTNNGTFTLENGATFKQGSSVTGGGTYNVKQTLSDGAGLGSVLTGRYWYMGTPVSCARSVGFGSASALNKVWSFTNGAYAAVADATMLSPTTGYVHRRWDNPTLTFSGQNLYATDETLSLSNNTGTYAGWHLIANPYTAYLDWHQVWDNSSNISPTYYIRSYNTSGAGDVNALITYNRSNGLEANTSSYNLGATYNNPTPGSTTAKYIAPMQAIWVKVLGSTSTVGGLSLNRNYTSHQTGNVGLKNSTVFPTLARVNLVDGARFDQMLVFMNQDMSNAVDQYDSEKMFVSGAPQIYTMAAGKKLVMNGLKNNKKKISVPLYLELPESKVYNLQLAEYILEDGLILLEDKQEGIIQDFTIHDVYPFYANSGVLSNRFVLHFFMPDATITAQGPSNTWVENESSYTEGGNILISSDPKGKIAITLELPEDQKVESSIQVSDANGRIVYNAILEGLTTEFQLNVPSGIYYLTVQSGNLIENKKVFIQE